MRAEPTAGAAQVLRLPGSTRIAAPTMASTDKDGAVATGRLIILNGVSSSGKTTLASALQAELVRVGECWIVIGIDDFIAKLPPEWVRAGGHVGEFADAGIAVDVVDGQVEWRVGPIGVQVFGAYRSSVAAAARAGLNVIVDEVIMSEEDWRAWVAELDGLDVLWVRVGIDLETVEARERDRGDRVVGLARSQLGVVHRFPRYGVEVDTAVMDPQSAAAAVLAVR
jgi:chloramphenicol 3-O phosphotransferase